MKKTETVHIFEWTVPTATWTMKKRFVGSWRISEIKDFDPEYRDLSGPATIEFSTRGFGWIRFGAISAELDCKMDEKDEFQAHFTFVGSDEGNDISGRGVCRIEGDELLCRLFIHCGDEITFRAKDRGKRKYRA